MVRSFDDYENEEERGKIVRIPKPIVPMRPANSFAPKKSKRLQAKKMLLPPPIVPVIPEKKPKTKAKMKKAEKVEQIMQKHAQNLVISTKSYETRSKGKLAKT